LSKSSYETPVIMVDRGNCTFATKAQNVQNVGGEIAMIVYNLPGADPLKFYMKDDGKHKKLNIPTIMISYEDGQVIKDFWKENKDTGLANEINLSVKFAMNKTSFGYETIDLYFTSAEEKMYKFLKNFRRFYFAIGKLIIIINILNIYLERSIYSIIPHYLTFSYYNSTAPVVNCYYNGVYCLEPVPKFGISDGRNIIAENIRQKCIYTFAYGNNAREKYWDYMSNFYDDCMDGKTDKFNYECSHEVMKKVFLDSEVIDKCVLDSFESKGNLN